jgi:hypothetical protein
MSANKFPYARRLRRGGVSFCARHVALKLCDLWYGFLNSGVHDLDWYGLPRSRGLHGLMSGAWYVVACLDPQSVEWVGACLIPQSVDWVGDDLLWAVRREGLAGEGSLLAPFKLMGVESIMSLDPSWRNRVEERPLVKMSAIWSWVEMSLRMMSWLRTFSRIK